MNMIPMPSVEALTDQQMPIEPLPRADLTRTAEFAQRRAFRTLLLRLDDPNYELSCADIATVLREECTELADALTDSPAIPQIIDILGNPDLQTSQRYALLGMAVADALRTQCRTYGDDINRREREAAARNDSTSWLWP